jgi:hypothetical protein
MKLVDMNSLGLFGCDTLSVQVGCTLCNVYLIVIYFTKHFFVNNINNFYVLILYKYVLYVVD